MQSNLYKILAVDDDEVIQSVLRRRLHSNEFNLTFVSTAEAALHQLDRVNFDLILCDLQLPRMSGLELLAETKKRGFDIPLIVMTAYGSTETAIQGLRQGVFDYILKPLNTDEVKLAIEKALEFKKLQKENSFLRTELKQSWQSQNMIGKSAAIQSVFNLVSRVAPTHANVLINGESGTGKELVARAIHFQSARSKGPFVAINCSAIPGELLESELFGHAKGAFTGAHQAKKGLFEEASGGTIFLDEIGDLDLSLQAKLLRVLQERKIKPVGENSYRDFDARIVAATHKDLRNAARNGQFREDLYFRLCVIPIEIPPLRQRKEDIVLLVNYFIQKHAATHALPTRSIHPDALSKLISYKWPGNVRELENIVERSMILSQAEQLSADDVPDFEFSLDPLSMIESNASKLLSLEEMERHYVELVLRKTGGKKEKAAQILGIDRKTLRRKVKDFSLTDEGQESQNEEDLETVASSGSTSGECTL